MLLEVILITAYVLAIGYLGVLGLRRTKTATDYLIAGRQTHPFVMAMSYGATFISTAAIVGFGGVAGMFGMSLLWLTFLNILVGVFIAFVFLGGRTRRMGHHLDAHTFPELLGRRYGSKFIQVFAGLVIFIFIPLYAAAVLIGGCHFISKQFAVNYDIALLVFSVLIAGYVIAGGLKGVMYTDALQGTIMFVGMLVLLIGTYWILGGVTQAHTRLSELGSEPNMFAKIGFKGWTSMPEFGWGPAETPKGPNPAGHNLWWIIISAITLGVGIGVLAQPQLAVRFMTVRSKKELNRAVLIGGIFLLVMVGVPYVVGSLSNVYFHDREEVVGQQIGELEETTVVVKDARHPDQRAAIPATLIHLDTTGDRDADTHLIAQSPAPVLPTADITPLDDGRVRVKPNANSYTRAVLMKGDTWYLSTGQIMPIYVKQAMPRWFGVLFLLTLLAAAMSTLSSQFHAVGTSIGRDVYEQLSGRRGRSVLVTRLGVIIGILIAVLISYQFSTGSFFIARATAIFFGLCASTFLPAYVGGLFWRGSTRSGAIASMLSGFTASAFWLMFIKAKEADAIGLVYHFTGNKATLLPSPNWQEVDPVVIALPLSVLVFVAVSLLTRRPDGTHLSKCFGERTLKS